MKGVGLLQDIPILWREKKGMETKKVEAVGHLLGLAFTLISCGVLAEDYPEPRSIWSSNSWSNNHKT